MKSKWKRVLSAALACMMVLALLPASALAAEDAEMAETEIVVEEETVIPAEDVEVTEPEAPAEDAVIPEEDVDVTEAEVPEEETFLPEEGVEAAEPEVATEASEEALTDDAAAPTIIGFSVGGTAASIDAADNVKLTLDCTTALAGATVSLTTSEAVSFEATSSPAGGALYASAASANSVTLNFNVTIGNTDLNDSKYGITLTTSNGTTWTGTIGSSFAFTAGDLAAGMQNTQLTFAAGTMVSAAGVGNTARALACNKDVEVAYLVACGAGQMCTVTYVIRENSTVWQLPAGTALLTPTVEEASGETFVGWYADAGHNTAVDVDTATVSNGLTLYAWVNAETTESSFAEQYAAGASTLTIETDEDWASFISLASSIGSSKLVVLNADINCGGATYTSLTFGGNFNGNGKTISNATFNANGDNSGMFATLGPDQIVANLTLSNITVKSATNAGVLAGSISGSEGHRPLIQNVHVSSCSVSGRNAGGIAGYAFVTDIKFCSNRGTTVTGVVNGGGIAGISYSVVSNCYATKNATALASAGGIVGKNLETGNVEWCWCTSSKAVGYSGDNSSAANNVVSVTRTTNSSAFAGFNTTYWSIASGTGTTFTDQVAYSFPSN